MRFVFGAAAAYLMIAPAFALPADEKAPECAPNSGQPPQPGEPIPNAPAPCPSNNDPPPGPVPKSSNQTIPPDPAPRPNNDPVNEELQIWTSGWSFGCEGFKVGLNNNVLTYSARCHVTMLSNPASYRQFVPPLTGEGGRASPEESPDQPPEIIWESGWRFECENFYVQFHNNISVTYIADCHVTMPSHPRPRRR
jgi:hypothetical protein